MLELLLGLVMVSVLIFFLVKVGCMYVVISCLLLDVIMCGMVIL